MSEHPRDGDGGRVDAPGDAVRPEAGGEPGGPDVAPGGLDFAVTGLDLAAGGPL